MTEILTAMGDNAPTADCPRHGTHGNLFNGQCWWCVMDGTLSPIPPRPPVGQPLPVSPSS